MRTPSCTILKKRGRTEIQKMHSLQTLNAGEISAKDFSMRRRRIWMARHLKPLAGHRTVFAMLLKNALQRIQREPGFALYPSWAQQSFSGELIVYVPTSSVRHYMADWLQLSGAAFHSSDYFLASGDWGNAIRNMDQMPVLQEARELMAVDWRFRETVPYARFCQAKQSGTPISRQHVVLDTSDKIDAYFHRFASLHRSINEWGLLKNAEAMPKLGVAADREIGVAIDADGSLIKLPGGQHRFALAVALNLEFMPVEVRLVHGDLLAPTGLKLDASPIDSLSHLLRTIGS